MFSHSLWSLGRSGRKLELRKEWDFIISFLNRSLGRRGEKKRKKNLFH
jgi:hypothetical protein